MNPIPSATIRDSSTPTHMFSDELEADQRGAQRGGDHGDAGGQVELPADHQQRHPDRDDADRRGGVEHRRERGQRAERRRDREEEDEDRDRRGHGADLRTGQHTREQRLLDGAGASVVLAAAGRRRSGRAHVCSREGWRAPGPEPHRRHGRRRGSPTARTWLSACCSRRRAGSGRCWWRRRTTGRSAPACRRRCRCRWSGSATATSTAM